MMWAYLQELEAAYTEAQNDPQFQVQPHIAAPDRITRHASCLARLSAGCQHSTNSSALAEQAEYAALLKDYVGRPSPLYHAERLSEHYRR